MSRHDRRRIAEALRAEDVLLLTAVVLLPWYWGGIYLDGYRTAAAFVACAAGLALVRQGLRGLGIGGRSLWLLPAFLLGAWGFAQAVPLPRAWVALLSPKAASIQAASFGPEAQTGTPWIRQIEADARAHVPEAPSAPPNSAGALDLGPKAPAPPRRFTLSLAPGATLESAWWYAALLLAFLLVLRRTASPDVAALYRAVTFMSFGCLAFVGIVNRVTSPRTVLWLRDVPLEARPFGPYVNPSHFGGAMELAVPWLAGYGLWRLTHRGAENRFPPGGILALAAAVIGAAATVLAASKMAALTIGLSFFVLIAVSIRRARQRYWVLAGSAVIALLILALAISGPLGGRLADFAAAHEGSLSPNVRGLVWSAGLRMARDYALTGSGFSAFGEVLPAYLPRGESERWYAMHNDYLEVYLAGGLVAAALVLWLAAGFTTRVVRVVRSESARGRLLPSLGLALSLLAIAAHEAVDFNLQIPANALLFVALAAMAVSPLAGSPEDP